MKIAYIAHPIGGDIEANLADLRRIIRKINLNYPYVVPFCPYYADVVSLNDNDPREHARGKKNNEHILYASIVDELWLTGDRISKGMEVERDIAWMMGIEVVDYINFF